MAARTPEKGFRGMLNGLALMRLTMGKGTIEIKGLNNLVEAAQAHEGFVVATSHFTDKDLSLIGGAAVRVLRGNLGFTAASLNFDEPLSSGYKLVGGSHFYPVPYRREPDGAKRPEPFREADYDEAVDKIQGGMTMLVASHTPIQHTTVGQSEARPGVLAPYLALASDTPLVPVAVTLAGQEERPDQFNNPTLFPNVFNPAEYPFFLPTDAVVRFGPPVELNRSIWQELDTQSARRRFLIDSARRVLGAVQSLSTPSNSRRV